MDLSKLSEMDYKERIKILKEMYNVDILWSWSKYDKSKSDLYGFLLRYILKIIEDTPNSIYNPAGNVAHSILQDYYENKIKYEQMLPRYKDEMDDLEIKGYLFERTNKEKNEKIGKNYIECMELFFQNHIPLTGKIYCEKFMSVKINNHVFQGFIDILQTNDQLITITDWKTSSIYTGEDLEDKKGQLLLYAIPLIKKGMKPENIKLRWNFLKYVDITVQQANGKSIKRTMLRNEIGKKLFTNASMWMRKKGYNEEDIEIAMNDIFESNSISSLPKDIQSLYVVEDCYVYIDFTLPEIHDFQEQINSDLIRLNNRIEEYKETKNDRLFWQDVTKKNSYFFANLSGYSAKHHAPYKEYLNRYNDKSVEDDTELMEILNELI